MTNNMFMSVLRDYAQAARQKRKSFAAPVRRLVDLRMAALDDGQTTPEALAEHRQRLQDTVMREYAPFDHTFSFEAVG